ncbi:unnamed protein product [Spirodela intermedia]|uniref:Uncharacterized protein n=1 Tax=Spirodela intermedia TaxID=51605 RepID=A0A7I8K992_SPIIN|nr:unnamed protein product [Spirodela intermedia]
MATAKKTPVAAAAAVVLTDRARGDSCSSPLDEQSRLTFPNPQILESGRGLVKDMATARKTPVAATAAVLLLLIAAAALAPASASRLTIYRSLGCRRPLAGLCSVCYSFGPVFKGYFFNYFGGQVARFYPRFDCKGPYITVASNARRCYPPFLYRSIRMPCLT